MNALRKEYMRVLAQAESFAAHAQAGPKSIRRRIF
jgi:hypothetical protein